MKNQKGISTPFAILIVGVVVIIGFTIVFSYQYIWAPEEGVILPLRIKTPKDETADWKVYRNEEYGFEMKYSPDLAIREEINPANVLFLEIITKERKSTCFLITVKPNPRNIGLIEDLRKYEGTKYEDPYSIAVADCLENRATPITIGGKKTFKCETVRKPFISNIILVSTNDYIYHIKNLCEKKEDMEAIYNLILSTFKFIE